MVLRSHVWLFLEIGGSFRGRFRGFLFKSLRFLLGRSKAGLGLM